ncbi:urease accessory UreF family protein [Saccharibacillus sp. CPCC 101409]|uniref:urease accessory protein UreF n=1 Tax=Saccharibacillus sp. CPCC 101409 TaxID=3058041 RepID=UPI002673629A|nr:urease accessory UreF family protein [Saccharibacillus sp. CPCC 101409]MDO3408625.1 urease accessory UreF family protein [Saccharibacillus sp. CPCC 101409]
MHSGHKLLSYMTLLEPSSPSPVGCLKEDLRGNRLNCSEAFEEVMRAYVHPRLAHIEGRAIEDIYAALARNDHETVFRIDRGLRTRTCPNEIDTELRRAGRKLLKLSKSLYPWIDFSPLAQALQTDRAFVCPASGYAWINFHLEIDRDEAALAFLYHHTTVCVDYSANLLGLDDVSRKKLLMRMIDDVSERWSRTRTAEAAADFVSESYDSPIQKTL